MSSPLPSQVVDESWPTEGYFDGSVYINDKFGFSIDMSDSGLYPETRSTEETLWLEFWTLEFSESLVVTVSAKQELNAYTVDELLLQLALREIGTGSIPGTRSREVRGVPSVVYEVGRAQIVLNKVIVRC